MIPFLLAPRDPGVARAIDAARGGCASQDRATLLAQVGGAVVAVAALVAIFVTG